MRGERNKENANEHLTVVFIFWMSNKETSTESWAEVHTVDEESARVRNNIWKRSTIIQKIDVCTLQLLLELAATLSLAQLQLFVQHSSFVMINWNSFGLMISLTSFE